jgi:hypothetical protein
LTSVATGQAAYTFNAALNTNSAVVDTLSNFENITLSGNGVNYVVGSDAANVIIGGTGIDTINAGKGNDTINGGTGVDDLDGGAGTDTFVYAGTAELVALNAAIDTVDGGAGTADAIRLDGATTILAADLLTRIDNVEQITASATTGALSITATAAAGTFTGTTFDTIDFSGDTNTTGANVISITGATPITTIKGGAGVETITLGAAAVAATVTPGGGRDVIALTTALAAKVVIGTGDSIMASTATTNTFVDTIAGFTTTTDTISFGGPAGAVGNFAAATTANGATANFAASLAKVDAAADTALTATIKYAAITVGTETTYTTDNGKTYLIYDTDGDGDYTAGTDAIVLLAAATTFAATDIVI